MILTGFKRILMALAVVAAGAFACGGGAEDEALGPEAEAEAMEDGALRWPGATSSCTDGPRGCGWTQGFMKFCSGGMVCAKKLSCSAVGGKGWRRKTPEPTGYCVPAGSCPAGHFCGGDGW